MRYVTLNKKYYCGVDLHAQTIYVCVMTRDGKVLVHREIPCDFSMFYKLIKPYLKSIAVGCESTFNWYWLGDACRKAKIPFYLGHALYMKAIHGGKSKDDRIDSKKLADLLRINHFPLAYDYPENMRTTRDLLRRRQKMTQFRTKLSSHIKLYLYQQGIADIPAKLTHDRKHRHEILGRLKHPDAVMTIQSDLELIEKLDSMIAKIEWRVHQQAKRHDRNALAILQTVDGIGEILGLTILYEIHSIHRFKTPQRFSSYSRVVKVKRSSGGKVTPSKNSKIGNPCLRWAFAELAVISLRFYPSLKDYYDKMKRRIGVKRALARLSHKFAVAVYYMLKNGEAFDIKRFVAAS